MKVIAPRLTRSRWVRVNGAWFWWNAAREVFQTSFTTRMVTLDNPYRGHRRACAHCDRFPVGRHDGCLGELPGGVSQACCGHGTERGYVTFRGGETIYGNADTLKRAADIRQRRLNDMDRQLRTLQNE